MTSRFALIGAGKWGSNIINTLSRSSDMCLAAAVSSKSKHELRTIAPFDGIVFSNFEQLANMNEGLDGVIIATPPAGRERIIDFFLESAIPIFSEKPMTLSASETGRLVDKARHRNVPLVEDFIHLYAWPFLTIRDAVSSEDRLEVESSGGNIGPFRDYSPVHDYGPHDLSMTLQLFRCKPLAVAVKVFNRESVLRFSCAVELDFGKRGTALLRFGNTFEGKQRIFTCRANNNEWTYDDTASEKLSVNGIPCVPNEIYSDCSPLQVALESFAGIQSLYTNEERYWLSESVASLTDEINRLVQEQIVRVYEN